MLIAAARRKQALPCSFRKPFVGSQCRAVGSHREWRHAGSAPQLPRGCASTQHFCSRAVIGQVMETESLMYLIVPRMLPSPKELGKRIQELKHRHELLSFFSLLVAPLGVRRSKMSGALISPLGTRLCHPEFGHDFSGFFFFPKTYRKREKNIKTSENIHPFVSQGQSIRLQEGNGRFRVLKGLSREQKSGLQTKSHARMIPVKYLTQHIKARFDRFFSMTVTENWHSFPRGIVEFPSLVILKSHLDVILGSLLSRRHWIR